MDLFKFTPGDDATVLEQGQPINGWDSVMWTERYSEPGEFEIKAPLSSGLRGFLREGTFISHVDTMEVMIVESQHVTEDKVDSPQLTLTGRTLDSWLENRFVGANRARTTSTIGDYTMLAEPTWDQAVRLINEHIFSPTDPNDALVNVFADTAATGVGTNEARTIDRKNVLEALQEILAVDDLGIRTVRVHPFPGLGGSSAHTTLEVYRGADLSNEITLSWSSGDLDSTEYLFSSKKTKNSAFVVGKFIYVVVDTAGLVNYDRRMMIVDGTDVDGHFSAIPTGTPLADAIAKMQTRGRQALRKQNRVAISRADVSNTTQLQYRKDYNVGDKIMLDADYNTSMKTRVVEFVEIEDENGESGHPTLELPTG